MHKQLAKLHRIRAEIAAGIEDANNETKLCIVDVLNVTAEATG